MTTNCTMLIGIDASRAFVSNRTGTENYSYQLIKAMLALDSKNDYRLYTRLSTSGHCEEESALGGRRRGNLNTAEKRLPRSRSLSRAQSRESLAMTNNVIIKNISLPRLWTQVGLAKEVLLNPPDVLFVPAHTLPAVRRPGLKTVVTIHDLGYEYLPEHHQFPQKLYLNKSTEYAVKNASHLIAVSEATKKDLINKLGCPEEKITVIYEGFDKEKFKPLSIRHSGEPEGRLQNQNKKDSGQARMTKETGQNDVFGNPYILFVGTLQPRKNLERLIEAFSKICHSERSEESLNLFESSHTREILRPRQMAGPQDDNLNLVIAGNKGWLYQDILSAPKRFGVEDRVKFLGYTKEEDLPALYQNALCFCLPSLFEGFGLPVLEAMACGCPVVVSNTSSLPEVAGKAGLYVNPLDVNDMAKKLELVIKNKKLRNELSVKGLKQAQKFSWQKAARETIKVLTTCHSRSNRESI